MFDSIFFSPTKMNQNITVGTSLFTALATDRDISNGGVVYYSIDEVKQPSVETAGQCFC